LRLRPLIWKGTRSDKIEELQTLFIILKSAVEQAPKQHASLTLVF
jgi:hypothetical protein